MLKIFYKTAIIIFSCFLFFLAFEIGAQNASNLGILDEAQLKINSVEVNKFFGGSVYVRGESLPNMTVFLSVKDEKDTFTYSIKINSDNQGNWLAKFSQPLKSGKYYIEAIAQDKNSFSSLPVRSELIDIKGPFALIIGIFSFLVIILLIGFVGGWYGSKLAEIKRYRRILISQRDIIASYNILKNDVDKALKNLSSEKIKEGKINETKFFLKRISENLEKMNKYVVKGVNIISKYDIINKINNILKLKS